MIITITGMPCSGKSSIAKMIAEKHGFRRIGVGDMFKDEAKSRGLSAEELQDKIWSEYAKEFAHAVLQDMNDFSGDELFEIGEWWYMDIKEVMRKAVQALLSSGSYDDLNEEQNAVVVEFETELYKAKVDELRKSMPPEEIKETIHDWWQDYEIADGTEDNLLAYV